MYGGGCTVTPKCAALTPLYLILMMLAKVRASLLFQPKYFFSSSKSKFYFNFSCKCESRNLKIHERSQKEKKRKNWRVFFVTSFHNPPKGNASKKRERKILKSWKIWRIFFFNFWKCILHLMNHGIRNVTGETGNINCC